MAAPRQRRAFENPRAAASELPNLLRFVIAVPCCRSAELRHFSNRWALLLATLAPAQAQAAPEEIQVYMDELNAAGEPGLDIHVNDVVSGVPGPAFPGGEPSLHLWRVTPEWSLGLGNGFDAGAYLPLATITPDGKLRADGAKARLKWLAPHGEQGFYWGANYEVGYSDRLIDPHHWNNEIKLIAGWRNEHWVL